MEAISKPEARFWRRVDFSGPLSEFAPDLGPCWLWDKPNRAGYGSYHALGRSGVAHRWGYTFRVGPVPPGLELDHLCRVPRCVNPSHLEPVSRRENLIRIPGSIWMTNLQKEACPKGHPYDRRNTYVYDNKRYCLTCKRPSRRSNNRTRGTGTWSVKGNGKHLFHLSLGTDAAGNRIRKAFVSSSRIECLRRAVAFRRAYEAGVSA
jgi:hypothetical protein